MIVKLTICNRDETLPTYSISGDNLPFWWSERIMDIVTFRGRYYRLSSLNAKAEEDTVLEQEVTFTECAPPPDLNEVLFGHKN